MNIMDILSAPRRAVWGDTTGADVLSNVFGADPESGWTQGGGVLLDMLMDPMTYALPMGIGAIGRFAPKAIGALTGASRAAGIGSEIADAAAIRAAAQKAMTLNALAGEEAAAANAARIGNLAGTADFSSMALGPGKAYQKAVPEASAALESLGLGTPTEGGGVQMLQGKFPDAMMLQRGGAGGGSRVAMRPGGALPEEGVTPFERYLTIRDRAMGSVQNPAEMLAQRPLTQNPAMMGELSSLPPGMEYMQGMPAEGVFQNAQAMLAKALAKQAVYGQSALSPQELGLIVSAGAGGAAGGYLGSR